MSETSTGKSRWTDAVDESDKKRIDELYQIYERNSQNYMEKCKGLLQNAQSTIESIIRDLNSQFQRLNSSFQNRNSELETIVAEQSSQVQRNLSRLKTISLRNQGLSAFLLSLGILFGSGLYMWQYWWKIENLESKIAQQQEQLSVGKQKYLDQQLAQREEFGQKQREIQQQEALIEANNRQIAAGNKELERQEALRQRGHLQWMGDSLWALVPNQDPVTRFDGERHWVQIQ